MKVTPWFPLSVNPVRVGVYQTRTTAFNPIWFSYWNGTYFCLNSGNAETAASHFCDKSSDMYCSGFQPEWRGVQK